MADLESPAPAHRALGAGGDRSRHIQTLCERACAAPTASRSCPLRPVRADIPCTPATPESPSTLCVSSVECTQKRHLTESSIFECFHQFLRRADFCLGVGPDHIEQSAGFLRHQIRFALAGADYPDIEIARLSQNELDVLGRHLLKLVDHHRDRQLAAASPVILNGRDNGREPQICALPHGGGLADSCQGEINYLPLLHY